MLLWRRSVLEPRIALCRAQRTQQLSAELDDCGEVEADPRSEVRGSSPLGSTYFPLSSLLSALAADPNSEHLQQ
jgi:hypothetical protein